MSTCAFARKLFTTESYMIAALFATRFASFVDAFLYLLLSQLATCRAHESETASIIDEYTFRRIAAEK